MKRLRRPAIGTDAIGRDRRALGSTRADGDAGAAGRKAALLSIATLTVSSTMVIAPSLPAMAAAFANTPNAELLVKLTLTMPAIAIAICAPMAGWVIDRYGRLPMLYTDRKSVV